MKEYLVTLRCRHTIFASEDSIKVWKDQPDIMILCDECRKQADFFRPIWKIEEVAKE